MAINQNRPVISYENIALLQSDVGATSTPSNLSTSIEFIPLVQGMDVSLDFQRNNAGQIGSKNFINQSFQNAPDINLTINTFEDFGNLFSCLFTGNIIREDLDLDRNFYAVLGDRRSFDVVEEDINGNQVLSFGNCFLQSVSMSQTIGGVIQSSYNFVGSNLQADSLLYNAQADAYSMDNPAISLNGTEQNQTTISAQIRSLDYYYDANPYVIPYYNTNVLISGSGSFGNFLMNSESIQSFDLNLPINRKTIYSLGKKYPVKRKALFPSEGSFSFTNKTENFHVGGDRANLDDFLSYDEFYTIFISGKNHGDEEFVYQIQSGKLDSMNLSNSIGSNTENSLSFSFEVNRFNVFFSPELILSIDTDKAISTSNTEFKVATRSLYTYDCIVDWGDGSTDAINTYDDQKWSHTYSSAGIYQIKISGKFGGFYSFNSLSFREKLISIDNWGDTEIQDFNDAFYQCRFLQEIKNPIPENTIIDFSNMFEDCIRLTKLPRNLFSYCSGAQNFSFTFKNCTSLQEIPKGLFEGCSNALFFYETFRSCNNLEKINSRIFKGCNNVLNFQSCFQGVGIKYIPDDIFADTSNVTTFNQVFDSCLNFAIIPSGLFSNCENVITFESAFRNCDSVVNIPSGLFDNCVNVTTFESTFANSALIENIPSGLFYNCEDATIFNNTFRNCDSIVRIPSGLFDKSINATSFISVFVDCNKLEFVPSGLFKNTMGEIFLGSFSSCTSLTEFPADAFPSTANRFNGCFSDVTINTEDYSNLLVYIESINDNDNVVFDGGLSKANAAGDAARTALETDHDWLILDGDS